MAVKSNKTLWAMGENAEGQLGMGSFSEQQARPQQITSGVESVAAGQGHSLFVKVDGTLWVMGWNQGGQLGDGTQDRKASLVKIADGVEMVSAGCHGSHSLFVKRDGTLWGMGNNDRGLLGDGTTQNRLRPVHIASDVDSAAAGTDHSIYVKADGTLWAMGDNTHGQLGDGSYQQRRRPVEISGSVKSATAGDSLFVKRDGSLWGMGFNGGGELGVEGYPRESEKPVQITDASYGVRCSSAGYSHSLFVDCAGVLWGMGGNIQGQLGGVCLFNEANVRTPIKIMEDVQFAVAGGGEDCEFSLILKRDGTLWGMGDNVAGQLGRISDWRHSSNRDGRPGPQEH
eukprot:TRINITY_DN63969_c0_g1_i1.p1 TRINITY_DN63969_c0_g1~~TRINITY_DN63969_c0_g1_i1.p1  ORF type:complete len:389 (-),score=63.28 TRINITY_DN63969_c0_g1_i1:223-1248(-)